jgi:hypothetical protein
VLGKDLEVELFVVDMSQPAFDGLEASGLPTLLLGDGAVAIRILLMF